MQRGNMIRIQYCGKERSWKIPAGTSGRKWEVGRITNLEKISWDYADWLDWWVA
jgi:hypothetical protein